MIKNEKDKPVKHFRDYLAGKIDRRTFIIAVSAFAGGYGLSKFLPDILAKFPDSNPLTSAQEKTLVAVQRHLFPSTENSPGADQINALAYLIFVLLDPAIDPRDQKFIIKGIGWLQEECQKVFSTGFNNLDPEKKEQILRMIEKESWGRRWISNLLKYIFEALLTDPIYGGNPDGIGWEWLTHVPGVPRPTDNNRYGAEA